MKKKIYEINAIEIKLLKSNPPQLLIICNGMASTSGWENPELELVKGTPKGGVYEFNFFATPPSGISLPVLTPITAHYTFETIPDDLIGVKINAENNSMSESIEVKSLTEMESSILAPQLENIKGIDLVDGKVNIRVHSSGCTAKSSFQIKVIKGFTGLPPYIMEIYRIAPDYCNVYMPNGEVLEYTLKELGLKQGDSFHLVNKIG